MDCHSIIDRQTFDVYLHAEDYPKAFICDKLLSKVIALLNKKGYKTFASCSGHYQISFYEYFDIDIKELPEYENDSHVILKNIRKNNFDCWVEKENTVTYILFSEKYDFDNYPEGFEIKNMPDILTQKDRTVFEKNVKYYKNNDIRRTRKDVEEEIDKNCETLLKWAEKLPERKDDK